MIEFSNLSSLLKLELLEGLTYLLGILGSGSLCSLVIASYIQQKWSPLAILKDAFASKIFPLSQLVSLCIFIFSIWLYGFSPYALFIACILSLFYMMSYIDSVLLAIPDFLNFLCLFLIFAGLYFFGFLGEEQFISAFCIAGFLSLLKIFGNFIFRKEILGEADIVLVASMGAIILLYPSIYLLFISSVLAMAYILIFSLTSLKNKQITLSKIKIPFAVFLSLGFVIMLIYLRFWRGIGV